MDPFSFPPLAAVLQAAYGALMGLADLLAPLAGPSAAALAVVVVTMLVRAVLIPTGIAQAKAEQLRSRLAPKLRALQERHRKSPEWLQRETMKLYADENASPFAGCLPVLIQAPIVGVIYSVFLHASIAGHANALLTEELAGVPLGATMIGSLAHGGLHLATALVFGTIVVLLVVVAEITRRVFRPRATDAAAPGMPDLRWLGVLQFATAVVALFVPLAAALYLVVTVAWTLVQRVVLRRRYPLREG